MESKDGSKSETLKVDRVMVSIGFAPRVEGYGLEKTGVKLTDRGAIEIDERMRTNVPRHLRHWRRHREAAVGARCGSTGCGSCGNHRRCGNHGAGGLI